MLLRLREARRQMRKVNADPDDTEAAIRAIAAMAGNSQQRCFRRFKRSQAGNALLRDKPELFDKLNDPQLLNALPAGSLGRAIADFYSTEEISAAGLKSASEAASDGAAAPETDFNWFTRRTRELHDVFHVLTGYGRDLRGESAVLAFTVAQTGHTGLAYLVLRALRGAGWRSAEGRLIRSAYKRGRASRWLIDQDWESLLAEPLTELRERLKLGPPPDYEPLRSQGAPALS